MSKPLLTILIAFAVGCGGDDDGGGGNPDADPSAPDGDVVVAPAEIEVTTYLDGAAAPLELVAAQDGDGAWQQLDSDNGLYSFTSATGRYGVATVCIAGPFVRLSFYYSTAAEQDQVTRSCTTEAPVFTAIDVAIDNLAGDAQISAGPQFANVTAGEPAATLMTLVEASYDVWAAVRPGATDIESVMVQRDVQTSTEGTPQVTFDVDQDSVATTDFSLAIDGETDSEEVDWGAYLWSTRRTRARLLQADGASYAGVPTSALEGNDIHEVVAEAIDGDAGTARAIRQLLLDPANVTLTLPPAFGDIEAGAVETMPYVRVDATFDAYPDGVYYELRLFQGGEREVTFEATDGWLGDGASYTWEQPDLGDLDGWTNGWALADNVEVAWFAGAHRSTVDPRLFFEESPSPAPDLDGVTHEFARILGSFTP
jgi:hypothetical protein